MSPSPMKHDENVHTECEPTPAGGQAAGAPQVPVNDLPGPDAARAIARLRWRCRRGMRELDVLLERYLQQRYAVAPAAEQHAFESLLELPDPQLFAYLMRREAPNDPRWVDVLSKLAAFGS